LDVGLQFSADLRHIMVCTSRKHAGGGSIGTGSGNIRTGEGDLIAQPGDLTLNGAQSGLEVIVGIRHGRNPSAGCTPHSE